MAETYAPGSKEWWIVRQVANGDARRPWYELTDEDRAELDRRSPPTRELAPVYVGPYSPGSNEWWFVRRVATSDVRRTWYELTDADREALAAAPPPPDVSRGLDREAVAGLLRKTWHDFRYPPRGTPPGPEDADVFDAMAAALLAPDPNRTNPDPCAEDEA